MAKLVARLKSYGKLSRVILIAGEIIVALIANIENQEKRRADSETKRYPPEYPRASSTDDVEGYFATLHQLIGVIFDHKTFRDNNRKITQEFTKRVDPDLPF